MTVLAPKNLGLEPKNSQVTSSWRVSLHEDMRWRLGSLSSWSAVTPQEIRTVHQIVPLGLLVGKSCWLPHWHKKPERTVVVPAEGVTQVTFALWLVPLPILWQLSYDALSRDILCKYFLFHFFLSCVPQDSLMVFELSQRHLGLYRTYFLYLLLWSVVGERVDSFHCLSHVTSNNKYTFEQETELLLHKMVLM